MQSRLHRLVSLRSSKLLDFMRKGNLDGLLMTRIENVRYVSGFRPVYSQWFRDSYISILKANGEVSLLLTSGDYERARRTMPWIHEFSILTSRKAENISTILKEEFNASARIGYDSLEVAAYSQLKELLPSFSFFAVSHDIDVIRAVKLPDEIEVIMKGAKITEQVTELAVKKARPGVKECQLSAMAESEARALGVEGVSWSFATFAGPRAGLMFRHDTTKELKKGEFLILGYATTFEGYNSDITATTVVGESPSATQKQLFNVVLTAYRSALSLAKGGTRTKTISDEAGEIIERGGIDKKYSFTSFQRLLHGLGMNVYEPPFSPDPGSEEPDYSLLCGNVLAIEPAVAFFDRPNQGGIRIGETILIKDGRPKVLGKMPDRIISTFSK